MGRHASADHPVARSQILGSLAHDRLREVTVTDGGVMTEAAELHEAWRAVANAKLAEYRRQCWRLAGLAAQGTIAKADAIDALWGIAIAHALVRALGEDYVNLIIVEAFMALTAERAA